MRLRGIPGEMFGWVSSGLLVLVHLAAYLLSPWQLGRMMRSISLPRMREHRLRTSLTILGIALGVAVLVAVLLVSRSIVMGVTATVDDLAGKADLQVLGASSGFDGAVLEQLRDVEGVHKVAPVIQQTVTMRGTTGRRERVLLLGVDMLNDDDTYFRSYASPELDAIRKDPVLFLNSPTNIILSRRLAERMNVPARGRVVVGTASGSHDFDVWGVTGDEAGVSAAFGGSVGIMYLAAMQVALDRADNIDRIDIAVSPGSDPDQVSRRVQARLGNAFVVERPALRGSRISKMLAALKTALTMSSMIALFAGAFLVFNTIAISVFQRKRELGILRALGMTRSRMRTLITLEGCLLGVVGSVLGVAGGLGLARSMLKFTSAAVSEVYFEQSITDVRLDGFVIIGGLVVGIGGATFTAWLAVRRAEAIGAVGPLGAPTARGRSANRLFGNRNELLAVLVLALIPLTLRLPALGNLPLGALAACLMVLLSGRLLMPAVVLGMQQSFSLMAGRWMSVELLLANQNVARDVSRSASTASGLMAGVALTVAISTFVLSFVSSLQSWSVEVVPGDLFVTSGAAVSGLSARNTPMADSFRADLLSLPEVARIRSIRVVSADYRGAPIKLASSEIAEWVQRARITMIEGSLQDLIAGTAHGAVVVSENFSRLFAVHRGDQIELSTGAGTRSFRVAAVVVDYTTDGGTVLMDRVTYVENWKDRRVDTFELYLKPGADIEAVRRVIGERWGERNDLFVLTNREFRGEFVKAVDGIFSLMRVLEFVTLLVAALGIVTAVLANVLDRVREIGVLRALGMARAQVRKIVMAEAVLIGAIGALAGLLVGVGLGHILLNHVATVQIGWHLPHHTPSGTMLELLLVALPVSALAGFIPARQAAALPVVESLGYE